MQEANKVRKAAVYIIFFYPLIMPDPAFMKNGIAFPSLYVSIFSVITRVCVHGCVGRGCGRGWVGDGRVVVGWGARVWMDVHYEVSNENKYKNAWTAMQPYPSSAIGGLPSQRGLG